MIINYFFFMKVFHPLETRKERDTHIEEAVMGDIKYKYLFY